MSAWHTRAAADWQPPWQALDRRSGYRELEAGMIIGYDYRAWEVTHVGAMSEPDSNGREMRCTLRRLHGPKHPNENKFADVVLRYSARAYGLNIYRGGRVWLCSCCGDPVPCRMEVAEEVSASEAREFDARLNRMGPGICYACGEVITARQDRVTFPGDHADFPGRGGPTFHTRRKCEEERWLYARRAGTDMDGQPLTNEEQPCP